MAADGCVVVPGRTVAVSRDMRHLMGKWVHIEGVGKRLVHDVMNARYRQSVDVCMADRVSALEFGRRSVVVKVIR